MLNSRVLSLGILPNQNGVNVVVRSLVSGNRSAGSDVSEEVESSAEGQVEGDMAFANWCLEKSESIPVVRSCMLTASGPFSATLFLLMLSIVSGRMEVFPSTSCGVTSTGSHFTGAFPSY